MTRKVLPTDQISSIRIDWVDPEVTEFIFVYQDSSSIDSFMDRHHLLKLDASDSILVIDYCRPTDTICMDRSSSNDPFFFVYSCLFWIFMSPYHLMISRWVSFGRSKLPLRNSTQTHGLLFKPFGSCVTCFVFVLLLLPFYTITHRTRSTRLAGYPLSANG